VAACVTAGVAVGVAVVVAAGVTVGVAVGIAVGISVVVVVGVAVGVDCVSVNDPHVVVDNVAHVDLAADRWTLFCREEQHYCACVSSAARVLFGSCALAASYAAFSERTLMKC